MSLDYSSMTADSISELDPDDPNILTQLGLTPLPDYSNLDDEEKYVQLKNQYKKLLLMSSVLEYQRERTFNSLKACKPVIKYIDNDKLSNEN